MFSLVPPEIREQVTRDLHAQPPGRETYAKVYAHYGLSEFGVSPQCLQRYGLVVRRQSLVLSLPIDPLQVGPSRPRDSLATIERAIARGLTSDDEEALLWDLSRKREWVKVLRKEVHRLENKLSALRAAKRDTRMVAAELDAALSNKLMEVQRVG